MKKNHLTLKVFALLVLNDIVETVAQSLMKGGLAVTGISSVNAGNIAEFFLKNAASPILWAGLLICILNFFIWISILYRIDLSIAMPAGSASYIFVPIAAVVFFHEHVSLMRWIGTLCIILGIYFVSQSARAAKAER